MDTLSRLFGRTTAFDDYCDLALPRIALWRLICGVLTLGVVILALTTLAALGARFAAPELIQSGAPNFTSPDGVLFALGTFVAWPIGLALALWLWHRRKFRSLFNEDLRLRLRSYVTGLTIAVTIGVTSVLVGALIVGAPVRAPTSGNWGLLAAAAVLLLIVQTASEELLFRGYLQQQLGARFRSGIWWAILPSIMFGTLHWNPDSFGAGASVVILTAGVFGLAMAVIVARTGDLSLVMGLHLGVNVVALLLVAPANHLSGLALFHWPADETALEALGWLDFVILCAVGLIALLWDQRRRNLSLLPDVFR
jgi:membrane protease YdiL (CAAX protease family)